MYDKRTNTIARHMFNNTILRLQMIFYHSTLNSKHIKEDPCIHLRNLQTHISDNQNQIKGGPIFNPILLMLLHRFANAT